MSDRTTARKPTEDLADEIEAAELDLAWENLLKNPEGRAVIWSILDLCPMNQSTFTGNASAAFLEGKRDVGLRILNDRILPQGMGVYTSMLLEAEARASEAEVRAEREDAKAAENDEQREEL